jgi:hypothetical protein
MDKETAVVNCFDAAFVSRKGFHPQPDKSMDKDYFCNELDVYNIFLSTQACLSSKGYVFKFDGKIVHACQTKKVIDVLLIINQNTKPKAPTTVTRLKEKSKKN